MRSYPSLLVLLSVVLFGAAAIRPALAAPSEGEVIGVKPQAVWMKTGGRLGAQTNQAQEEVAEVRPGRGTRRIVTPSTDTRSARNEKDDEDRRASRQRFSTKYFNHLYPSEEITVSSQSVWVRTAPHPGGDKSQEEVAEVRPGSDTSRGPRRIVRRDADPSTNTRSTRNQKDDGNPRASRQRFSAEYFNHLYPSEEITVSSQSVWVKTAPHPGGDKSQEEVAEVRPGSDTSRGPRRIVRRDADPSTNTRSTRNQKDDGNPRASRQRFSAEYFNHLYPSEEITVSSQSVWVKTAPHPGGDKSQEEVAEVRPGSDTSRGPRRIVRRDADPSTNTRSTRNQKDDGNPRASRQRFSAEYFNHLYPSEEITVSSQSVWVKTAPHPGGDKSQQEVAEVRPGSETSRGPRRIVRRDADPSTNTRSTRNQKDDGNPRASRQRFSAEYFNHLYPSEEITVSSQSVWVKTAPRPGADQSPEEVAEVRPGSETREAPRRIVRRDVTPSQDTRSLKDQKEDKSENDEESDESKSLEEVEEGRGHMKKLKKMFQKFSPYLMVPAFMMLGYAPFILSSLKMFVMNAVMLNMFAFNAAIFLTLRNMVFGPRMGQHVKYLNYGYKKKSPYHHGHHG